MDYIERVLDVKLLGEYSTPAIDKAPTNLVPLLANIVVA